MQIKSTHTDRTGQNPNLKYQIFHSYFFLIIGNISNSVTDYRCYRDSLNATLYIDCRSILPADHCSHFSYHFMYIYLLISIDLQSSCSFNTHTLQSLQIRTVRSYALEDLRSRHAGGPSLQSLLQECPRLET